MNYVINLTHPWTRGLKTPPPIATDKSLTDAMLDQMQGFINRLEVFGEALYTQEQQRPRILDGSEFLGYNIINEAMCWLVNLWPLANDVGNFTKHSSYEMFLRTIKMGEDFMTDDVEYFVSLCHDLRAALMTDRPILFLRKQIRPLINKAKREKGNG